MMSQVIIPPRRAHRLAFWIVVCVGIAAVAALAASAAGASPRWAVGSAVAVLLPGAVWRPWFALGVRVWNRTVRVLFARLRTVAAVICFHTVFPLLRRTGTRVRLTSPAQLASVEPASLWTARDGTGVAQGAATRGKGWLADLIAHARQTGNWWLLALVPFIVTLMLLSTEVEETTPGGSTYTLY